MIQTSPFFGIDLTPYYGLIQVSGEDSELFLQGQLTVDMQELTPTKHKLGALCNIKGRIRALFRIFKYQNAFYLQLPRLVLPQALSTLKKFAKFSKVTLKDVSEDWQRFGIWTDAPTSSQFATLENGEMQIENNLIRLSLSDHNPRFEFLGPRNSLQPMLDSLNHFSETNDFDCWKLMDIRGGIPEVWFETIEQLLPHDINLPALGAVSFTKGCYCGQEIVARMQYRANLKRNMLQVTLPNTKELPVPGTKLVLPNNTEIMGTIVTAAFSSINTVEALIISSM